MPAFDRQTDIQKGLGIAILCIALHAELCIVKTGQACIVHTTQSDRLALMP